MRRVLTIASMVIGVSIVAVAGLGFWLLQHSDPPMPRLAGHIEQRTMQHGGRTRSWIVYVPAKRAQPQPLVIALHSSMGTAQQARKMYGYDFDLLADQQGFVVVSSVPTSQNMAVSPKNQAVSILLMNSTEDPMNPWRGGDVVLYGVWGNRGPVLSTQASIDYFRALAVLEGPPEITKFPDRDATDGSSVERSSWTAPGKPRVVLYSIKGGGHGVPHPATYGRRLLGNPNRDIHAANEIWDFFLSVS